MPIRLSDVFSTSKLSKFSYVSRTYKHGLTYDEYLANLLKDNDKIISISGPTKSGKTTLTKNVISESKLVRLHGADISSSDKLWELALAKLNYSTISKETKGLENSSETSLNADTGAIGWLKGIVIKVGHKRAKKKTKTIQFDKRYSDHQNAIKAMVQQKRVLLIDDFHYIDFDVQKDICRQLKGDLESEHPPIIICSIPSRADATTRALNELHGRVASIKFNKWGKNELEGIIHRGFQALNYNVQSSTEAMDLFLTEALGSPHVVQDCCKFIGKINNINTANKKFWAPGILELTIENIKESLNEVASELNYDRSYRLLEEGLNTKGRPRVVHTIIGDGDELEDADVYQIILKALEQDPPIDTISRTDIDSRILKVVRNTTPSRSSVGAVLRNLNRLVLDTNPRNKILEWDEGANELIIMDPLFLLYLRHANKGR